MAVKIGLPTRIYTRSATETAPDMKASGVRRASVHFGIDTGKSGGKIQAVVVYRTPNGAIFDLKGTENLFNVPLRREGVRKYIDMRQMLPSMAGALVAANTNLVAEEMGSLTVLPRLVTVDTFGSGAEVKNADTGQNFALMYDYLDPQWIEGMNEAVRRLGGGDRQKAMRHIFDGGAGQFGCGVYLLYHLLGIRETKAAPFPLSAGVISLPETMNAFLLSSALDNAIDESWARLTLFADRTGLKWNRALLKNLDLELILPKIVKSGTKLGELDPRILEAMECDSGSVIAGALHDTAGAFAFFSALEGLSSINVSSGSWNVIGMPVRVDELEDQKFMDTLFAAGMGVEGATGAEYVVQNVMGSMMIDPMFQLFSIPKGEHAKLFEGIEGEDVGFAYVNCMSGIFSSIFDPETPDTLLRAIAAYCEKTGQKIPQKREEVAKTIVMSMILGMVDRVRTYTMLMNMLGRQPGNIQAGGGVMMNNRTICQALANATGLVVRLRHNRVAGLGNTILALKGAGLFSDEELRYGLQQVSSPVSYIPDHDPGVKPLWDRVFDEYCTVKAKE